MSTVTLDESLIQKLAGAGVSTLLRPGAMVPTDCEFEPPCSFKRMGLQHSLRLGAFSYGVSGYYFACRIGRYTSMGESIQAGRGAHPTSWLSTSPFFYRRWRAIIDAGAETVDGVYDLRNVAPKNFVHSGPPSRVAPIEIGNDVWIGHGAFLKPGIEIGDGAVIAAHAVVTKSVPPYALVAGNPGVVKRLRFPEHIVEQLLEVKWWRFAPWDLGGIVLDDVERSIAIVRERTERGLLRPYSPSIVRLSDLL